MLTPDPSGGEPITLAAIRAVEARLRAFARRFVGIDDVEDVFQETVTRALEAARVRAVDVPEAFLFGVARNVVRKRLHQQAHALIALVDDFSADDYASDEPGGDDLHDERERLQLFGEVLATLPPQCRRVFVLKKVFGYSHKEIAERLNISVSTIEKHVAAGLRRCMDEVERRRQLPVAVGARPASAGSGR